MDSWFIDLPVSFRLSRYVISQLWFNVCKYCGRFGEGCGVATASSKRVEQKLYLMVALPLIYGCVYSGLLRVYILTCFIVFFDPDDFSI